MQLHNITTRTKRASRRQIGRGGKRGKTSGRGTKGQKARAGHRIRPQARDEIKKIPKLRGRGKNLNTSIQIKPFPISLTVLERAYADNETVSLQTLHEKGVIRKGIKFVKILNNGEVSKKLNIVRCRLSAAAEKKITAAGGTIKA